jgi:murein DD-endopeptidase MepM/ murein hydrolase activator NlpD
VTARAWIALLAIAALATAALLAVPRFEAAAPEIDDLPEIALGKDALDAQISLRDEGSGLRAVVVRIEHAGGNKTLFEQEFPGSPLTGGRVGEQNVVARLDPAVLALPDGPARLIIVARDFSWRNGFTGNLAERAVTLRIDTVAPRVHVESGLTYVHRGGSGAVVYQLDETAARDGVVVDSAFFRGHPIGPSPSRRVAVFAVPVDAAADPTVQVIAEDVAGNRGSASFPVRVLDRDFEKSGTTLSQRFVQQKVVPLAAANGLETTNAIQAFQQVNETLRGRNEARIREAIADPSSTRYWIGAFEQLRGSKVTSRFAEQRRYLIEGLEVSRATHYGFDLASTSGAQINAANAGVVVFAADLGIYGNCVVVDHGLGLSSLYGHLSELAVEPGQQVQKGQALGRSGSTGLAGGDHLHFAMLVGNTYVDPLEWWDPKWVRDHIEVRLQAPGG